MKSALGSCQTAAASAPGKALRSRIASVRQNAANSFESFPIVAFLIAFEASFSQPMPLGSQFVPVVSDSEPSRPDHLFRHVQSAKRVVAAWMIKAVVAGDQVPVKRA